MFPSYFDSADFDFDFDSADFAGIGPRGPKGPIRQNGMFPSDFDSAYFEFDSADFDSEYFAGFFGLNDDEKRGKLYKIN